LFVDLIWRNLPYIAVERETLFRVSLTVDRSAHSFRFGINLNRTDISDHNYGNLLTGFVTEFTVADFFAGGGEDSLAQISLGATQRRLIGQLLWESVPLILLGAASGLVLARILSREP
jgi:hypothetical protein